MQQQEPARDDQTLELLTQEITEQTKRALRSPPSPVWTTEFTPYLLLKVLEKLESIEKKLAYIEEEMQMQSPIRQA